MDNPFGIKTEQADIRPIRFYQKFIENPDGTVRAVDWVDYSARGQAKFTVTPARVSDVQKMINGEWECLRPHYEAWQRGNESPVTGTPLAAWSGVSPELAAVLKTRDILTVEDIRDMTEAQMEKSGVPGMRTLRDQARAWDASKDTRKTEIALNGLQDENAALRAQMEEMKAMMASLAGDGAEPKRGPGRPKKEAEAA